MQLQDIVQNKGRNLTAIMAVENGTLTTKVDGGSPYQLDMAQVSSGQKDCVATIAHQIFTPGQSGNVSSSEAYQRT